MVGLVVVAGMVVWGGVSLVLDTWRRVRGRRRPSLAEHLSPAEPSLADEAEQWLKSQ